MQATGRLAQTRTLLRVPRFTSAAFLAKTSSPSLIALPLPLWALSAHMIRMSAHPPPCKKIHIYIRAGCILVGMGCLLLRMVSKIFCVRLKCLKASRSCCSSCIEAD